MMTTRHYLLGTTLACAVLLSLCGCNNEEEVVPLTKENTASKQYKLPDPVLLTNDEQAEVQRIRDEYRNATTK